MSLAAVGGARARAARRRDYPVTLLISLITIAALIPSILLAAFTLDQWSRNEELRERGRVSALAQMAAHSLDRHLKALINTAEVLAGSRHLVTGDFKVFGELARDAAINAEGHFILIRRDLQQIVNTRAPVDAALPRTSNPEQVSEVFRTGTASVTDLNVAAVGNTTVFAILVPVKIEGDVRYVLAYVPEVSTIVELLRERQPRDWLGAIVDGKGRIVARTVNHDAFFGKPSSISNRFLGNSGVLESVDLESRAAITAYHRLTTAPWTAVTWVDKSILAEPRNRRFRLFLAMIAAALTLSFLASSVVSRVVRGPAIQLRRLAELTGTGGPATYTPTIMREANVIGESIVKASREISEHTNALQQTGQRLQLAIDAARAGFWTMNLATGAHHLDARAMEIAGFSSDNAIDIAAIIARIHEDDRGAVTKALREAREAGGPGHFDVEFRLMLDSGERWVSTQAQRQLLPDGELQLVGIIRDVTRRKHDEQKIKFLMREVVHRSKNLLAVVQSIAGQTARSGDPATFLPRFRDRLGALASNQTLLVESEWKGVCVLELAKAQLAHYEDLFGRRIKLEGEPLLLTPDAAQSIGIALHELATNAAKYGALSNDTGSVHVQWNACDVNGRRRFRIVWTEVGGPPAEQPVKPGFGSVVTGRMVEAAVNGSVSVAFEPNRFRWELETDAANAIDAV